LPAKRVFITLGSNIEAERNLDYAVRLLADEAELEIVRVSRVYRSRPIDAQGKVNPEQDDFLNAAVLVETDLPILDLKRRILRRIEQRLERVRTQDKFAPRTIDLDIVLYGNDVLGLLIEEIDDEGDMLHPDMDALQYAHVALPLGDLDPDFVHPLTGETLGQIAGRLGDSEDIEVDLLHLDY
jgi:2-amino-4-hydroxy-6-hydroxymethyldihydropteridine diphosphokinase